MNHNLHYKLPGMGVGSYLDNIKFKNVESDFIHKILYICNVGASVGLFHPHKMLFHKHKHILSHIITHMLLKGTLALNRRVDRVLGFFSSRPNWPPSFLHRRAIRTRGQTLWYSRYKCILCSGRFCGCFFLLHLAYFAEN